MPIKPENRDRYPEDWGEIRQEILQRAQYRCEWPGCGAKHHSVGRWVQKPTGYVFQPTCGSREHDRAGRGLLSMRHARSICAVDLSGELLIIVLTIAHLDHTPENCAPENLRAWCQRHHLAYDHKHHLQTAYMARKAAACNFELEL